MDLIDFGMGEPREETPAFIRAALADAIEPLSTYPTADGPARAARGDRRLGRRAASAPRWTPTREVLPTLGSKEAIFHLAQVLGRRPSSPCPRPRYPVYERGALFAARRSSSCRCARRPASSPTSTRCPGPGALGDPLAELPEQPDRARPRPLAFYERAAALAREHGFVLACDEAYSELYFGGEPPVSALQLADLTRRRGVQHAVQALVDAGLPLAASSPATRS